MAPMSTDFNIARLEGVINVFDFQPGSLCMTSELEGFLAGKAYIRADLS